MYILRGHRLQYQNKIVFPSRSFFVLENSVGHDASGSSLLAKVYIFKLLVYKRLNHRLGDFFLKGSFMPVMTEIKVRESSLLSFRDKLEYQKFAY